MINNILGSSCKELIRKAVIAKGSIENRNIPEEVIPCRNWVIQILDQHSKELERLESYIKLDLKDKVLNQTIYSDLTNIRSDLEVLDTYYIHPLSRMSENDRVVLQLIQSIHDAHNVTRNKPFLITNGGFSISPSPHSPTLYWLPVTSQMNMLDYPLLTHEFGHQLFMFHKDEMEDLITEFQLKLAKYFQLAVTQDDKQNERYIEKSTDIIETWREWAEELFCDAVGLILGGRSYLLAFSHFIRMGGIKEFYVPEKYLAKRSHPVSLLRIRFLVDRGHNLGYTTEATRLEEEWEEIVNTLDIKEDYFGFYDLSFKNDIYLLLEDMLVETNPVSFEEMKKKSRTPVALKYHESIDEAWDRFIDDPETYPDWERKLNTAFLDIIEK